MYFTNTPALNSMEAIMKKLPYGTQKGGGRFRRLYQYTKKDCDCRLCLYYRKKNGCALALCPVLDIRLGCGAATIGDAVKAIFKDAQNTAFQKRLSQIYHRKDDAEMPNHVVNHISLQGDPEKIRSMLETIKSDEHGIGSVDFNKIIPMSKSLDIEASSRTDRGLKVYRDFIDVYTLARTMNKCSRHCGI